MKRRALFIGAAAIVAISVLTACGGSDKPSAAPTATSSEVIGGQGTGAPVTPNESLPYTKNPIDKDAFLADVQKANATSYRSITTVEHGATKVPTEVEYEKQGNVDARHLKSTTAQGEFESITIGDKEWIKSGSGASWELVNGITFSNGGDSLKMYAKALKGVTFVKSEGTSRVYDLQLKIDGAKDLKSTLTVDDKLQVTNIVSEFTSKGTKVTSVETRSDHGAKFNIKAPI